VTAYVNTTSKKSEVTFVSSGYGLTDKRPVTVSFRKRLMATLRAGLEQQHRRLQPADDGESCAGQGRDVQRRLGRPGPDRDVEHDGICDVVRHDAQCKGLDFSYRLDRPEVLAWILNPNRPDAG
jgi:hypothetical protein